MSSSSPAVWLRDPCDVEDIEKFNNCLFKERSSVFHWHLIFNCKPSLFWYLLEMPIDRANQIIKVLKTTANIETLPYIGKSANNKISFIFVIPPNMNGIIEKYLRKWNVGYTRLERGENIFKLIDTIAAVEPDAITWRDYLYCYLIEPHGIQQWVERFYPKSLQNEYAMHYCTSPEGNFELYLNNTRILQFNHTVYVVEHPLYEYLEKHADNEEILAELYSYFEQQDSWILKNYFYLNDKKFIVILRKNLYMLSLICTELNTKINACILLNKVESF